MHKTGEGSSFLFKAMFSFPEKLKVSLGAFAQESGLSSTAKRQAQKSTPSQMVKILQPAYEREQILRDFYHLIYGLLTTSSYFQFKFSRMLLLPVGC